MSIKPKYFGWIRGGKLQLDESEKFSLLKQSLDGARVVLTLDKYRKERSSSQNRYLHGVVLPIAGEHFGYTADEMKEVFRYKFLKEESDEHHKFPRLKSTTELNTAEFADFVNAIIQFCSEHGIEISSSDKVDF